MKRSIIVIALALPGAVMTGFYGLLAAAFSGDANPNAFASFCFFLSGGVGGACLGALPGLIAGLYLRVRWVFPFIGAAIGAIYFVLEAALDVAVAYHAWTALGGSAEVRQINVAGYASGVSLVLGFLIGVLRWRTLVDRDRQRNTSNQTQPDPSN